MERRLFNSCKTYNALCSMRPQREVNVLFMGESVMKLEKNPANVIACPYCLGTLTKLNGDLDGFECKNCGALYPIY